MRKNKALLRQGIGEQARYIDLRTSNQNPFGRIVVRHSRPPILRVLNAGPLHGFGIGERINVLSKQVLEVEEGSLYPALYRMESRGWIKAEWGQSELGRKAKLYSLTPVGRRQLEIERKVGAQRRLMPR